MPPELPLQIAVILLVAGLMAFACWRDLAIRTLPDGLAIGLAVTGIAWQAVLGDLGWSLMAAGLVFCAAGLAWRLGALGGGDVKLLVACALLPGAAAVPQSILITALAGGLLSVAYVLGQRFAPAIPARRGALPARVWRAEIWRVRRGGPLPYAVAVTAGTLVSMLGQV